MSAGWQEANPSWVPLGSVKGPPGDTIAIVPYTMGGELVARIGNEPLPLVGGTYTITDVAAMVGIAPMGTPVIIDVRVNGVSIFPDPAQRPRIEPGTRAATGGVIGDLLIEDGDYLTVDVVQPGAVPAEGLTVAVYLRRRSS